MSEVPSGSGPKLDAGKVQRGAIWTLLGFGSGQVIRFASSIVLVNHVFKEGDFGIAALVFGFMQGLMNFGDLGVVSSIVQNKNGHTREFRSTAWTVQLIRSSILALVAFLASPFVAGFYGQPVLEELIRYAAIGMLIGNLSPTSYHVASRNLGLGKTVGVDLASQVIAAGLSIGWGLLDPRPHVLVWGSVVSAAIRFTLIRAFLGGDDWIYWHPPSLAAILKFGKWACVGSLLTFATSQADRLIFGTMLHIDMLGVYSNAMNIISVPGEVLSRLTVGVIFPVLCQRYTQGSLDVALFRKSRLPLQVAAGIMLACLCGAGPAAIGFLFRAEFADAGWMVQIMAIGCWIGVVMDGPRMWLLIASGHNRWSSLAAGFKLAGLVVLLPLGYHLGGFPGALAGYAASDIVKYAASLWGCSKIGLLDVRSDVMVTGWFLGTSAVAWGVRHGVMTATGSHFVSGLVVLLVVTAMWSPLAIPYLRWRKTTS